MSKRILVLLSVLALVLTMLAPIGAADEVELELAGDAASVLKTADGTESYIVVMEGDPLVVTEGQDNLGTPAAEQKADELVAEHDEALKEAGAEASDKVNDYTNALNGFSAVLSEEEALELAAQPNVKYVIKDVMRYKATDNSPRFLGLTDRRGAWASGWDGEGVVVGVIDSGIWPEHPSFADDGTYPPAPVLDDSRPNCEFGNTAHNPNDAAFECNNKLIGARQMLDTYRFFIGAEPEEYDSARDEDGHGTHTASTAAGNSGVEASVLGSEFGEISGMAPRAHIIAYKGLGILGGFSSDLAAAIDQAVLDGVDVINYSIGGGASLTGADDIAFLFAETGGVFVVTSAGNDGPGAGTIGGPASVPWITSVGASTQNRTFTSTVTLGNWKSYTGEGVGELGSVTRPWGWGSKDDDLETSQTFWWWWRHRPKMDATQIVDAEDAGDELCNIGALDETVVAGKIVLCKRGAIALVDKSQAVLDAGGVGIVLFNADDRATYLTTHAVPAAHISYEDGLAIKAYIDAKGAKAKAVIDGGNFKKDRTAPAMASFSSRGPDSVAEDIIKPDVTAPGYGILAGYSPTPTSGAQNEMFSVIQGTSMSSPHVAGVMALIKEAHPDWSAAMAKSALMTTSYQKGVVKEDGVTPADPFDMGAGHIDPGGKASQRGSLFNPGLVYDAGLFEYAGFTCGLDLGVFTPGSCDFLEAIGVPFDPSDLNLPSIGVAELAGSQTVIRTVTSVADRTRTFIPKVKAPAGFQIVVSPNRLRLAPGDTATFEVTITNKNAPIGEWRFGSLTWKSGGYQVYSPIAVKGALFNAPAEISSTGVEGTTSFDVSFGYTGDYTAAPHGLVPEILTTDTVGQDDDQEFQVTDVGDGATAHPFTLTDTAFFRFALVHPDPDVDLDVFLYDSVGEITSSTNGGTDELIELVLPADDSYTLYVHGWQTLGVTQTYTFQTWDVPATPGTGPLTMTSSPASASLGDVGTIDLSWSGLLPGTEYLGAVSHSDASGLIGLTLVGVNTN